MLDSSFGAGTPAPRLLLMVITSLCACGGDAMADPVNPDAGMNPPTDAGRDAEDDAPDMPPEDSGSPAATGTIEGTVRLGQAFTEDGIGDVIVEWGGGCPYSGSFDIHGLVVVPADFTASDSVDYTIPDLDPGLYQVWGWFDDNGDTIPEVSMAAPEDDLANVPCRSAIVAADMTERINLVFDEIVNPR